MKKDLLLEIKGDSEDIDIDVLKENIIGLFDDLLKEITDPTKQGLIARLRSKIIIELKDL